MKPQTTEERREELLELYDTLCKELVRIKTELEVVGNYMEQLGGALHLKVEKYAHEWEELLRLEKEIDEGLNDVQK